MKFLRSIQMPRSVILGVFLLVPSVDSYAENHFSESVIHGSGESPSQLTRQDRAKLWGITEREFQRYQDLMAGPIKYWNRDIDPVMVLGIFAESEQEEQRYAEIYALNEHDLITKTQKFERAYHTAFKKLFPDAPMISDTLMRPYYDYQALKTGIKKKEHLDFTRNTLVEGDRILFFVDVDCKTCHAEINHLQRIVESKGNIYVDIYILNIDNEKDARRWANKNKVNIDLVQKSIVTINVDAGSYANVKKSTQHNTRYFLHRNETIFSVSKKDIFLL